MSQVQIIEITNEDSHFLAQVEPLFSLMYEQMALQTPAKKLKLSLVSDGSKLWLEGIKRMLGRMGLIIVAVENEKVIAFIYGHIHFTPDYFGSLKVGTIAHVFVLPEKQGLGLGRELLETMEQWLISKNVHSIGLQVISGNMPAIAFWKKGGYEKELLQFRKMINV
ncbi:MAG: GNAT family N-acetyltransferase [Bacteroidetes bacterium]|nr:GNAT family N-acetyltransferase [Bacteroidota bacterium]